MKNNSLMLISVIILFFFSILNLYGNNSLFIKQIIWYSLGFITYFILKKINKRLLFKLSFIMYFILNILLLYLLLFGNVVNGSKAWINIGSFSFQPSELMKMILIIILSYIANKDKYIIKSFVITLIPSILTFLEPETGNVIFYFLIFISILLIKNFKLSLLKKIIAYLIFIGSLFFSLYYFYNDLFIQILGTKFFYRIDRVVSLFTDSSYQLNQALNAIGSSYLFGGEYGSFIPEATTDFAFALLVSKIGFIGICIYLLVNLTLNILILDCIKTNVGVMKLITCSFICLKFVQESIHILMNIGLFPITGITLPFISYGGTSIITYFALLGIINNSNKDFDMG